MDDDLDHMLLEQIYVCKRGLKNIKRLKKLFGNDPLLSVAEEQTNKKIMFFENNIFNKEILNKKIKRNKKTCISFNKNPIMDMYKNMMLISYISYKLLSSSIRSYIDIITKGWS